MGDTINIISWNVRGLDYPDKGGMSNGCFVISVVI